MAEVLALLLLAGTLALAVTRPRGLPEAAAALPAAAISLATGVLSLAAARSESVELAPTLAFLAAMLVVGDLCEREGLFAAAGEGMARASGGRPRRLLGLVFAVASAVTAVLGLDATVVLLTPVVLVTAATLRVRPKPHVYACVHLANSASLLLPVSNLSNLLAFHATGLSFARFGALMAPPWVVAIALEWAVFRRFFARELSDRGQAVTGERPADAQVAPATAAERPAQAAAACPAESAAGKPRRRPRYAAGVLALMLGGFVASSALDVEPFVVALAGAVALAVPALAERRYRPAELVRGSSPGFLAFVLGLGLVVRAAVDNGVGSAVGAVVPGGASLPELLAIAAVAAVLANLISNLPAILILLPALAGAGAGPVLAALIGVNVGPNLTYVGSLATLLWRRTLRGHGAEPALGEFLRLGLATVPAALTLATVALWAALKVAG